MLIIYLKKLSEINRKLKIILQMIFDLFLISFSIIFSFFLRVDKEFFIYFDTLNFFIPLIFLTIFTFYFLGFYKNMMRYLSINFLNKIFVGSLLSFIFSLSIIFIAEIKIPRSIPIIYFIILFVTLSISRILIVYLYFILNQEAKKYGVAIFGAGVKGKELASNLLNDLDHKLICFIDDNTKLQNLFISSIKIVSRKESINLIKKNKIHKVFISTSNLLKDVKKDIFEVYSELGVSVKIVPSISKIINEKYILPSLRNIELRDLLGREPIKPNSKLFKKVIYKKTILITGAGGSIGSELCSQIIEFRPKKIILLESSEFALFTVFEKIKNKLKFNNKSTLIVPVLSNLSDLSQLSSLFKKHTINTIYHAAAYKHVSFVELNIIEAFKNNFKSTQNLLNLAIKYEVDYFTLVSTDKAVNPSSIMGATKRLSEILCQHNAKIKHKTIISIVRFGNVLGSSGSVVPKFEKLISEGGPIYINHPELTRFFMLISEASQLVIQASALSKGGEIFVLDMGDPIKILDLAKLMIRLNGSIPLIKKVNKKIKKNGSFIEIIFSKLGKGEKIHEELYTSKKVFNTSHKLINYEYLSSNKFGNIEKLILKIDKFIDNKNEKGLLKIIENKPINYKN